MVTWLVALAANAGTLPDIDVPLKTGARAEKDAAVVVGIEDYLRIPDVPYAQRDAKAMYDFLVYTRGVPASRVRLLDAGASREQIADAVRQAGVSVAAGGTVWVYFAGHGAADPSTGERLLLGDDVRSDPAAFSARGVPLSELKALAQKGGGTVNLLVDACYSGVGRGGQELVAGKRFAVPVRPPAPTSTALEWNAASADQMSGPLEAARHGAFTYFAVGAMRGWADGQLDGKRDGKVTAEEANLYVADALRAVQITTQKPELAVASAPARVLSSAGEVAPTLTASVAAVPSSAPSALTSVVSSAGTLDPRDRTAMLAWFTQKFVACHQRLAGPAPDPQLSRMAVRLRVKPGPKPVFVWAMTDLVDMMGPVGTVAASIGTCVQGEVKSAAWANPAKDVIFQDTVVVAGAPSATSTPASSTSPTATASPKVTMVFLNPSHTWLDVTIDGVKVELRNEDQVTFSSTPGKHRVEVRKFLGDVLSSQSIETGALADVKIGVSPEGKVECYNCP
jgi:hypothetical protein